jgi:hypothetical protein
MLEILKEFSISWMVCSFSRFTDTDARKQPSGRFIG